MDHHADSSHVWDNVSALNSQQFAARFLYPFANQLQLFRSYECSGCRLGDYYETLCGHIQLEEYVYKGFYVSNLFTHSIRTTLFFCHGERSVRCHGEREDMASHSALCDKHCFLVHDTHFASLYLDTHFASLCTRQTMLPCTRQTQCSCVNLSHLVNRAPHHILSPRI